jgi:F-type H+-transporting ATPase subunit b
VLEILAEAAGEHAEPTAFGIAPHGWVAIAMLVVIAIMLRAGVPAIIAKVLDDRIAAIRHQLDEARKLRAEAETLRNEYVGRMANAEADAKALIEHARREADAIRERAETDSKTMIERRKKMAEDKIAAAEREAIEEVRAHAAMAAAEAARSLIAERHTAEADRRLADEVIASI